MRMTKRHNRISTRARRSNEFGTSQPSASPSEKAAKLFATSTSSNVKTRVAQKLTKKRPRLTDLATARS